MSDKSTVLVQINDLGLGGTQLVAIDLAKAVESYGYHSILYGPANTVPAAGPNALEVAKRLGVTIETFDPASGILSGGAREFTRRAKSIDADIIHVYGTWAMPRSAYWGPCRGGRLPFVHTVYETTIDRSVHRHNSLVVGTGYHLEELARRPGPTALVRPPVDVDQNAPDVKAAQQFRDGLGELGRRILITIVSRLDLDMKSYPVEVGIRAMARLADMNAVLVVVGAGSEADRLEELGRQVNVAAGRTLVHFTGSMADPRPAYAAADIALGMGNSAARSLAFGTALVVHGERGTSELFEPATSQSLLHRNFWNPERQDNAPGRQAALLRELISDPLRRKELGSYGYRFAHEQLGLQTMAKRLAEVYDGAIGNYGRTAWIRDLPGEAFQFARSAKRRLSIGPVRHRGAVAGRLLEEASGIPPSGHPTSPVGPETVART